MTVSRSTYIVAESHSLAQPLIDALELKRSHDLEKLRVFANESVLLMESRGGAMAAAAAVGYLLGRTGFGPQTLLLHVGHSEATGAAGAPLVGRLVLVNRVRDGSSGRCYYPDILVAHEFGEAGVCTLRAGAGVGAPQAPGSWQLADAELSGVVAAALTFLAPHQVCCLSAVTRTRGGLEAGGRGDAAGSGEASEGAIVTAATAAVVRLIEAIAAILAPAAAALDEGLRGELEAVGEALRLTATQSAQLRRLAEGAAARGDDVSGILSGWKAIGPLRSKQERNRRFDELKRGFEI